MATYHISADLESFVSDLQMIFGTIGQADTIRAALILAEVVGRFIDKNQQEKILTVVDFRDGKEVQIKLDMKRK